MALIYGVDSEGVITPELVRDAMVRCFSEAHGPYTGLETKNQKKIETYCRNLVVQAFAASGGDFDHPTKESILKVMSELVKIASQFREQEIIARHYSEIMGLVAKL